MAGLLDAYELTGSIEARDIAVSMGHWVAHRLTRLDHERIQRMWSLYIAGEFGGMNETMARLSVVADEPLFLEVAQLFDQDDLLAAGAERRDVLTDMHANQHLPQLLGYLHEYDLTGERRYLEAVLGLWDQIDHRGDVHVVTAGVHDGHGVAGGVDAGRGAGIGEACLFADGQRVHVGACPDDRALAVAQDADHAGDADALVHLEAEIPQVTGGDAGGARLLERQFRVLVQVCVERFEVDRSATDRRRSPGRAPSRLR